MRQNGFNQEEADKLSAHPTFNQVSIIEKTPVELYVPPSEKQEIEIRTKIEGFTLQPEEEKNLQRKINGPLFLEKNSIQEYIWQNKINQAKIR